MAPNWLSMAIWSMTPQCSTMRSSLIRKMPTDVTSNVRWSGRRPRNGDSDSGSVSGDDHVLDRETEIGEPAPQQAVFVLESLSRWRQSLDKLVFLEVVGQHRVERLEAAAIERRVVGGHQVHRRVAGLGRCCMWRNGH
jgi:hypothetical protein